MESETTWNLMFQTFEGIRHYHRQMMDTIAKPKITAAQARILGCVVLSPNGSIMLKDIASELGITPGGVSQLVDSLEKHGHLVRVPDRRDRRVVRIRLSPGSLKLKQELDRSFSMMLEKLTQGMPKEKLDVFTEVLRHMQDSLNHERMATGR